MPFIKKVASRDFTWLMSDHELQVMSLTSVKKIFYKQEICRRQNITKPFLTSIGFKLFNPEVQQASKPERLVFGKTKVPNETQEKLAAEGYGEIYYN